MKNKIIYILLALVFVLHIFLRFSYTETKSGFAWDQVDNAWAAKNIIVDHKFPLVGMVAKGNSGIYIGPAYYYLISIVYFFTNLDPIASGIFAGITSIFSLLGLYFVVKKLFSIQTAIIACIIHVVSFSEILFDRVQWPVDFIPVISLLIFFCLYKTLVGEYNKYLIPLAFLVGFSFNIHFTAIFFPIIILCSLPFFPWSVKSLKYIFISLPFFLVWIIPSMISEIQSKHASTSNSFSYLKTYFHGFHLRRVMQLFGDAFIQIEALLVFKTLRIVKYFIIPAFYVIYLFKNRTKNKYIFCYLIALWFIIPWFAFSTYSGEISDYYFSINRFIGLMLIAYLVTYVWNFRFMFAKVGVVISMTLYGLYSLQLFSQISPTGLAERRVEIKKAISVNRDMPFREGSADSYLYYFYNRSNKK